VPKLTTYEHRLAGLGVDIHVFQNEVSFETNKQYRSSTGQPRVLGVSWAAIPKLDDATDQEKDLLQLRYQKQFLEGLTSTLFAANDENRNSIDDVMPRGGFINFNKVFEQRRHLFGRQNG
jgi:hypothetical protein